MQSKDYQARSRFGSRRKAVRPSLPARLLLSAPSGAGKTWTALSIASVLTGEAGTTVVIDTEQQQGEHTASVTYADVFDFDVVPWRGADGFDIRDLTQTLREGANELGPDDCTVIDGISPFWNGTGGVLDMVDGRFGSWAKVRPMQDEMLRAIKEFPSHVILTVRAKQDWQVTEYEDQRGRTKQKVERLGMGIQFDANIIYEMQVSATIDLDSHALTVDKSRSTLLADRSWPGEREVEFAEIYKGWLAGGHSLLSAAQATDLVSLFDKISDDDARTIAKREFVAECGRPSDILADDLERAAAIAERIVSDFTTESGPQPKLVDGEAA